MLNVICRPGAIKAYTYTFKKEIFPERFENIVDETNGHILFQEQLMELLEICKLVRELLFLKILKNL